MVRVSADFVPEGLVFTRSLGLVAGTLPSVERGLPLNGVADPLASDRFGLNVPFLLDAVLDLVVTFVSILSGMLDSSE